MYSAPTRRLERLAPVTGVAHDTISVPIRMNREAVLVMFVLGCRRRPTSAPFDRTRNETGENLVPMFAGTAADNGVIVRAAERAQR
jgi:hypothetical protein